MLPLKYLLAQRSLLSGGLVNTCYSLVAGNYGISVAGVYSLQDGKIAEIKGSGGVSPKDAKPEFRQMEATYALGWYASITKDVWGTGA